MKSHFQYEEEEEIYKLPDIRESVPRRIYIKKDDESNEKYGLTLGCRGCEAANRGLVGIQSETCRARVEKEIAVKEPERFERVNKVLTKLGVQEDGMDSESTAPGEAVANDSGTQGNKEIPLRMLKQVF